MTSTDPQRLTIWQTPTEQIIETHISYVLLTPDLVYKIKKPLQFSFLDFSSLAQRKYFCEEELRLNRRLTNEMYLEVVPVYANKGAFWIGKNEGDIVDYAVKMKRMDTRRQMHLLLEKNEVTPLHIEQLAAVLVAFHKQANIICSPLDIQALKTDFNDIRSVKNILTKYLDTATKTIDTATALSDHFLEKNIRGLDKRIVRNMIRDVHGDLHSGNIFLLEKPVVFDCIEFNAHLREIDILNELAFFCIDLDAYRHEDYSRLFMRQYRALFPEIIQSDVDEKLFLYYKLYRANVRAKVHALKIPQMTDANDRSTTIKEVQTYLTLMQRYMEALDAP